MNKEQELIIKIRNKDIYAKRKLIENFLPEIKKVQNNYTFLGLNKRHLKDLYTNLIEENIKTVELDVLDDISFIDYINLKFSKLLTNYTSNKNILYYDIIKYFEENILQNTNLDEITLTNSIIKTVKILGFIDMNGLDNYNIVLSNSKMLMAFMERLASYNDPIKVNTTSEILASLEKFNIVYNQITNSNSKIKFIKEKEVKKIKKDKKVVAPKPKKIMVKHDSIDNKEYHKLVTDNMHLVDFVAKKYMNKGLDNDEIMSAGNLGLIMAARKYDPSTNNKFSTYAVPVIKSKILDLFRIESNHIVFSKYNHNKISKFRKIYNQLDDTVENKIVKTAQMMGISLEDAELIYSASKSYISLNSSVNTEDDFELIELIKDDINIEEEIDNIVLAEQLINNTKLSKRSKEILLYYYGFMDNCSHTYRELGEKYNVTGVYISDIIEQALTKIRSSNKIVKNKVLEKRIK